MFERQMIILTLVLGVLSPANAAMRPESKAGALEAGQFVGVAEQCFKGSRSALTKAARRFAETAQSKTPKWYYEAYNAEVKGDPAVYDEAFCNDLVRKDYGPEGAVSRRLGFTVLDVANFVE